MSNGYFKMCIRIKRKRGRNRCVINVFLCYDFTRKNSFGTPTFMMKFLVICIIVNYSTVSSASLKSVLYFDFT